MNILNRHSFDCIKAKASELIGDTPMLELAKTGTGSRLLLKLEQFNPTGSCKVRMARSMILAAEREGKLKPGGHIVEPTSGNTGTGLALVALERGYRFTAVVDHHASRDKLRAMKAMGADLIFVEGNGEGPSTVQRRRMTEEIVAATGAFWPDQHYNPNNNLGYIGLAEELLRDVDADVDYLVGAVGTGGTLCGTVKALRMLGSNVTSIGVEPAGSIIFGGPAGKYWQSGAGAPGGFTVGPNVDHAFIDEGLTVDDVDAFSAARVIARRTGLLIGGTAGAAIHVAMKRLALVEPNSTMVVLVCDAGEKYLDSIYDDDWLTERHLLDGAKHMSVHGLFDAYQESMRLVSAPAFSMGAS
ncbi:cysteine synthase family protein [Agrobacterium vitis]|uniref:PLP-dependent cysteine synthase family protein n=1 Tax=Agrobacterium vitis TaxID=373 RepID=UPI001F1596D9|nr:cysteine synthase family protein [Agrobacterium vitis]MCF1469323.1 cysteine synthase family protein [Agrobacterium vitis]